MSWSEGACSYSQALKGSRHASPNGDTDETSLHALAIEPRGDTSTCERRQVEQHLPVLDFPQRHSWSETGSASPGSETYSQNLEIRCASSPCAAPRREENGIHQHWDACDATAGLSQKPCSYSQALKGERYVPPHGDTDESSLHPLAIEPRLNTGVHEIRKQAVRHPQTPDFYDLQRQLSGDGTCHGTSAAWSSSETGPEKSKCAAQIGKIVKMVKRKLPEWEEQEIHRRVVDLRKAEGGFSYMTLNAIVARVLSHIRDTAHDSAVRPTS
uniref:Uncharacterized protein n=1 Tax=Rhipicephalus zambeziensis TaxID=60191 RepID=A0A224YLG7_9ACAR